MGEARWERRIAIGLTAAGAAMVPWLVVLGIWLPGTIRVSGWATAWLGLDGLEGLGLLATGTLLRRGDARAPLAAAVTATLLLVDAWFDLTTSSPGPQLLIAAAMAIFAEIPVCALCAGIALRTLPRERRRATNEAVGGGRRTHPRSGS